MSVGALITGRPFMVPRTPPAELAVAPNYEAFDGLNPLDHPGGGVHPGSRPGQSETPLAEQTYTAGPLSGVVGTVGGQPLPVGDRIHRPPGIGQSVITPSVQHRLGVGQANQGVAQTVALSQITGNPPVAGDLSSILAGWG